MKRRSFLKEIGLAGGLAALPLQATLARAEEAAVSNAASDGGATAQAWHELVEVLAGADRSFTDPRRGRFDDRELAYAYRYLAHILSFAINVYVYGDPDAPVFVTVQDAPVEKTLGGNPDVVYAFAPVRGSGRYRITGRRGDEAYLSFTLHRGVRGSGFQQFFDSHLNQHQMKFAPNGDFEIIVSPEREGENWLRASPDATEVYARAYLFDRNRDRPATFHIESLDTPVPRRPDTTEMAARLRQAAQVIREFSIAIPQPLTDANQIGEMWKIDANGPSRMWQALDNTYCRGVYELEPGQALLLEGTVVPCDYWGIQLWNPFLGSGDFRLGPVSINTKQAHLADGKFRVAIAREDPRVPGLDWISTAGERRGTFFVRWMCAQQEPPRPTCRLVSLAELRG